MESAWNVVIATIPNCKWYDFIQLTTGIYVRYIGQTASFYQWSVGGQSWAIVSNLTTFLTAGTLLACGSVVRA